MLVEPTVDITQLQNTVVLGDCLEVMSKMTSESVDVAFADPPFNLKKRYTSYRDARAVEDYVSWCAEWLREMVRVTKPTGSIFVHNIPKWLVRFASILDSSATFRHWIAWDAMGSPLGRTLMPNHYGILYYVKSKDYKFHDIRMPHRRCRSCGVVLQDYGGKKSQMHPFGPLVSDVWADLHRIRHKLRRDEHPCQLPIPLLERLILMSSDEGDLVLDPFLGAGTTAVAAKKLGRRFTGIELDPKYRAIALQNVGGAEPTKLGDCPVSIYLGRVVTIRDRDWPRLREHFHYSANPLVLERQAAVPRRVSAGRCASAHVEMKTEELPFLAADAVPLTR